MILQFELLAIAVVFDYVINVFVAAAGASGEDGTVGVFFRPADGVGDGMGTFQGRNDTFIAGEHEKCIG